MHSSNEESQGNLSAAKSIEYTELLLQLMSERRNLLFDLKSLNQSQADSTQSGDINVTLGLLARKEALLDDLAIVRQKLQAYQNDEPEERTWESEVQRGRCKQLASEGDELLRLIVELEKTSLRELESKRDAVAAQLQNGKDSKLARYAYTAGEALNEGSLDLGG